MARHGLDVKRLDGLFMVPLGSGQNALFGSWLSATLTRLADADSPLEGQALAEQLLEDCLFILDNACQRLQGDALGRRDEERAIMRRVSEWAADCPEETLNLMELAQVAGVSLRQLQQAFKAFTDMPPGQWLRLRRLNGARRDLLRHGAGGHRGRGGHALVILAPGAVFRELSAAVSGAAERNPQARARVVSGVSHRSLPWQVSASGGFALR